MDRRRFLTLAAASGLPLLDGCALMSDPSRPFTAPEGDDKYKPWVGQPGKDVIWVPTPDLVVRRMLEKARVGPDDLVYDLGCGDGKIPIAAARLFGATAKGIEYEPGMADLARRNVSRAGVGDKVEIVTGDIFDPRLQERFMSATVITMYLLQELNLKLRPTLLRMQPGTRVVSHAFHMVEWEPDDILTVGYSEAFYWVVPADVAGRWRLRQFEAREATLELSQRFQRIGGTLTIGDHTQHLLGPYLNGDVLGFTFIEDGDLKSVRVRVRGDHLEGALRHARMVTVPLHGERLRS